MSLIIDSNDESNELSQEIIGTVEGLLNLAARKEGVEENSELSLTFVSNDRIQEINREYRGKDYPTDVISFALEEMGEGEIEVTGGDIPRILGDIIISVPKAHEQAKEYEHSFIREIGFLAVHGFLHLLGYDHENEKDEEEMFGRQRKILDEYGLQR